MMVRRKRKVENDVIVSITQVSQSSNEKPLYPKEKFLSFPYTYINEAHTYITQPLIVRHTYTSSHCVYLLIETQFARTIVVKLLATGK